MGATFLESCGQIHRWTC